MFRILLVDSGLPVSDETYPDAQSANAKAQELRASGKRVRLERIVTAAWREREASRFVDGTYRALPDWWQDSVWWQGSMPAADHFAHMSQDGKRIAFTESAAKGEEDKQLVMKASAYLGRFFAESLASEEIAAIATRFCDNDYQMFTSFSPEDFARIYESMQHPYSCMRDSRATFGTSKHPAYVYGAGDLQIAWIADELGSSMRLPEKDEKFMGARSVIYPATRRYALIYGSTPAHASALEKHLLDAGYRQGSLEGARLLRIEEGRGLLAPYIDGGDKAVSDDGDFLIIDSDGEIVCDSSGGTVQASSRYRCDECGDRCDEDETHNVNGETWCQSCYDSHTFFCEYYEESYPDSDGSVDVRVTPRYRTQSRTATWCQDAANNHAFYCESSDTYYSADDFTRIEVNTRHGAQTWCEEENDDYFFCEKSGEYYSCADYESVEVETETRFETWCKESCADSFFVCAVCGEVKANSLRAESDLFGEAICEDCADDRAYCEEVGITPAPIVGRIEDARQFALSV